MIRLVLRNIIRFVFLVLFQVLVLNNVSIMDKFLPHFYILFIILMPFETPRSTVLLSAFALGLTIDVFSDTLGLHTMATVFAAYIRPFVLRLLAPRDGYETGSFPRAHYYGFPWFIKYTVAITLSHQLLIYVLEIFSLEELVEILYSTLISTIFTSLFLVVSQFFMFRK